NIVEGIANVDRRLLEMGDAYRLSGREKFRSIVVPSTLPYLIAGMKVGFGLALKVSVVAEIFGVTSGIGYIMNYSREILATQMVFVWALVMIPVMMATDASASDALSRRGGRWPALSEGRGPRRLRGLSSGPGVGRHAAAHRHRARARHRARRPADGRAVRRAGRPEPAHHAERGAAHLARHGTDDPLRHPRH